MNDHDFDGELPLVSKKNRTKFVYDHFPSHKEDDPFASGFLEAMDFLQYVVCYFSIAVADEIWPPRSEYDIKTAYEIREDGSKLIVYNHFYNKYKTAKGVYEFYNSLDYNNRRVLYIWYKKNVLIGN